MSSAGWRIDRHLQQLGTGRTAAQRISAYVSMWESRCYEAGIPDDLPELLAKTNRAPSWKKIAVCILRNDMKLRGLGYTEESYNRELIRAIEGAEKQKSFRF